jgi:hypothetical protein
MEYMFHLYSDENVPTPAPDSPEFGEFMGKWMAFNQVLIDGGHWVSGASLMPTPTATSVRIGTGAVTDGPFMETKEQLGGYYLISAENLDQALALAAQVPLGAGTVEVRPVAFRPDAMHEEG